VALLEAAAEEFLTDGLYLQSMLLLEQEEQLVTHLLMVGTEIQLYMGQ
jgi:hypothetical protein